MTRKVDKLAAKQMIRNVIALLPYKWKRKIEPCFTNDSKCFANTTVFGLKIIVCSSKVRGKAQTSKCLHLQSRLQRFQWLTRAVLSGARVALALASNDSLEEPEIITRIGLHG